MSIKISKGLFEAVWNCDIKTDKDMLQVYNTLDINSFFFKCKEWAYNEGYTILTYKMSKYPDYNYGTLIKSIDFKFDDLMLKDGKYNVESFDFGAKTEQQIVFDSCQYILEQLKDA